MADTPTPTPRPQPVLTGHLIALVLAIGSAVGVDLSDELAGQIAFIVAGLIGVAWTAWGTRNKVTPLADPVDNAGVPLVPATDVPASTITVTSGHRPPTADVTATFDPDEIEQLTVAPEPAPLPPVPMQQVRRMGLLDGVDDPAVSYRDRPRA